MDPMEETLTEYVQRAAERASLERAGYEPEPMKAFSVRLPEKYVNLLDLIAEGIGVSRSDLLGKIIQRGAELSLETYASTFSTPTPEQVYQELRDKAGFNSSIWDTRSQTQSE